MALKSTVFKAELQIADMNRNYYHTHALTLARHPSETDERMMMRILAFALNADENLVFANGLTSQDEPDLWQKDFQGSITQWILVGLPDEKLIKKSCSRAEQVIIYSYGHAAHTWWSSIGQAQRLDNLRVINIKAEKSTLLALLAERTMKIQCTIQDNIIWLSSADDMLEIELNLIKTGALGS